LKTVIKNDGFIWSLKSLYESLLENPEDTMARIPELFQFALVLIPKKDGIN